MNNCIQVFKKSGKITFSLIGEYRMPKRGKDPAEADLLLDFNRAFSEYMDGLSASQLPKVVIDLEQCYFIDSSGLGTLVVALSTVKKRGGSLCISNLINHSLIGFFALTRMNRVFEICGKEGE